MQGEMSVLVLCTVSNELSIRHGQSSFTFHTECAAVFVLSAGVGRGGVEVGSVAGHCSVATPQPVMKDGQHTESDLFPYC